MNLFCHRGLYDNKRVIENTLEAFKKSIDLDLAIEIDIRVTKDKKIVVFHDRNLKRMSGFNNLIKNLTYEELKKIKLLETNSNIPLLSDVLKLINGKVPLLIEIKEIFSLEMLKKLDRLLTDYNGKILIQSFNPIILYKISLSSLKRYKLGILVSNNNRGFKRKVYNFFVYKHFIKQNYCNFISVPKELVISFKKISNKPLYIWTIRTIEEYKKYKKYSPNLICEKDVIVFYKKNIGN